MSQAIENISINSFIPPPLEITAEELRNIPDPIVKMIAEDYVRRGFWKIVACDV
nr:hypothetical protein [uncultured Methanospirillum sp.]